MASSFAGQWPLPQWQGSECRSANLRMRKLALEVLQERVKGHPDYLPGRDNLQRRQNRVNRRTQPLLVAACLACSPACWRVDPTVMWLSPSPSVRCPTLLAHPCPSLPVQRQVRQRGRGDASRPLRHGDHQGPRGGAADLASRDDVAGRRWRVLSPPGHGWSLTAACTPPPLLRDQVTWTGKRARSSCIESGSAQDLCYAGR